jgi:hypothetical protein
MNMSSRKVLLLETLKSLQTISSIRGSHDYSLVQLIDDKNDE